MTILRLLPIIQEYSIPRFPWFRGLKVLQDLYHQPYVPLNIPQPIKPAGLTPPCRLRDSIRFRCCAADRAVHAQATARFAVFFQSWAFSVDSVVGFGALALGFGTEAEGSLEGGLMRASMMLKVQRWLC